MRVNNKLRQDKMSHVTTQPNACLKLQLQLQRNAPETKSYWYLLQIDNSNSDQVIGKFSSHVIFLHLCMVKDNYILAQSL